MKKVTITLLAIIALMFIAGPISSVSAQTSQITESRSGVMPVLYDANGTPVNTSGGTLPTGTYYLDQDGRRPVSYTDGVYYESATNTFGGSIYNPTGRAGAFAVSVSVTPGRVTPGVPNTGSGGNANTTWALLAFTAAAGVAGATYAVRAKRNQSI